jgi:hypothetical protein
VIINLALPFVLFMNRNIPANFNLNKEMMMLMVIFYVWTFIHSDSCLSYMPVNILLADIKNLLNLFLITIFPKISATYEHFVFLTPSKY